jgi:multisubunit Na+/H+ antiporter MnhC subunit
MSKTKPQKDATMKLIGLFLVSVALSFILTACGSAATATEAPAATEPSTEQVSPGTPSLDEQMARIDSALRQTLIASIAYNKPESMNLDQTVTIELLLNPSVPPEALSTQVTEPGQVASTSIQITPRMKALLVANDPTAFVIQSIHDNPEQLVSSTDTTRWAWLVTAKEAGTERLTLIIYRLVKYEGQDYWREVKTYRTNIDVKVTFGQQLRSLDWKWIVGVAVTALLIPAFWRWYDQRKKQTEQTPQPKQPRKKTR